MTLSESIANRLSDNALDAALDMAKAHLKSNPSDQEARHLYIDLLVLAGEYERADTQCSLAVTFAPDATMGFALLRNELRGMAARDAWFASGAVPEFPGGPSNLDKLAVRLGLAHRMQDATDARRCSLPWKISAANFRCSGTAKRLPTSAISMTVSPTRWKSS
ncbi:hypothetical protein LZK73_29450 (plasmid) [Neorhizobium galegae]|nr:hypothetical protein LZK73_29450 [Neorhizobium galegae]